MAISNAARKDIFDSLMLENISWSGRLQEPDFLARLFDIKNLPSKDYRFHDAYGDIWQHRVNNPHDWDDNWVFYDSRFDLSHCDDDMFLLFLCETLHPVVRDDPEEIERLRQSYNHFLRNEGYEIVERARMGGRPVFVARQIQIFMETSLSSLKEHFNKSAATYVAQQITRMESAIYEDTSLAIGTSKELVETICRTILSERGKAIDGKPDLPKLVKATVKELELAPENIPDHAKAVETIRILLSNLATITNGIAELRNKYGTGHGKEATAKGLDARHAKLAVGAASTLAVFLLETHQDRLKKTV